VRSLSAAALALGAALAAGDARALWDDRLELFAAETLSYDDNVYRISSSADTQAALGTSYRGDSYGTTAFGFNLDAPLSRQRFQANLTLSRIRYERFSVLSHDARQGGARWLWRAGDSLDGRVGYSESVALASLANVQSGVQSGTPNMLTTRRAFASAGWMATPRWHLSGEASRSAQSNGTEEFQANDVTVDGAEVTLAYVTPANNRLGVNARAANGSFPNPQLVNGLAIDNAYREGNVGVLAEWSPGAHSRLSVRAGRVRRDYAQLPERNFEDATLDATLAWTPRAKLALTALAQTGISETEQINVSLVYVERIALGPEWRPTTKLLVRGALERANREYHGDPGLVLGTVAPLTQRVRGAWVAAVWMPHPRLALQLSLRHESRTANADLGDYKANVVAISGRIAF
jgi:exopolysaccharide biosynthesis operon protein EpsL